MTLGATHLCFDVACMTLEASHMCFRVAGVPPQDSDRQEVPDAHYQADRWHVWIHTALRERV